MIWAIVSSWSCFCWLYRASPSLAAKNIISLILVLTIWWFPCVYHQMSKNTSLVLLEEGICYGQCILLTKLYQSLPCFFLYSEAKFAKPGNSWLPTFAFQFPIWKGHLFWVFSLEDLVGLHRSVQLQFLQHYCLGHTWITVILNCLLGIKEIILSFLRLHLSTGFWTLLFAMMATPFLLRDSCPQ